MKQGTKALNVFTQIEKYLETRGEDKRTKAQDRGSDAVRHTHTTERRGTSDTEAAAATYQETVAMPKN